MLNKFKQSPYWIYQRILGTNYNNYMNRITNSVIHGNTIVQTLCPYTIVHINYRLIIKCV